MSSYKRTPTWARQVQAQQSRPMQTTTQPLWFAEAEYNRNIVRGQNQAMRDRIARKRALRHVQDAGKLIGIILLVIVATLELLWRIVFHS